MDRTTGTLVTASMWNLMLGASGNMADSAPAPWLIQIEPVDGSHANTNWSTRTQDSLEYYGGDLGSTGAQNAEVSWEIPLSAGTWTCILVHRKGTAHGIFSVRLAGAEVGTVDSYNASNSVNNFSSITGIVVSATGRVTFALRMATKNASSTNYFGYVQHITWLRTA